MVIENVKNYPYYKTFTNKSISIDKICLQISIIFKFFLDSVENKTIFLYEIKYEDEFFADLIKSEIKTEDINQICLNVEKYLNNIVRGLDITNFILINCPFDEVWREISTPKDFFGITNKKLVVKMNENDITLSQETTIYEKNEGELNPIIKFETESLFITSSYIKISLTSMEKFVLPSQKMVIFLKKLNNEKCLFSLNIKLTEPIKHQVFLSLKKLWKKN